MKTLLFRILLYNKMYAMKSKLEISIVAAVLLTIICGLIYHPDLPIFMGEFNSVDGSIYAAGLIYFATSLTMFFCTGFYLTPIVLDKKRLLKFVLYSFVLIVVISILKQWLDHRVLVLFNLPTNPDVISDKMLIYYNRKTVNLPNLPVHIGVYALGLVYGLARDWIRKSRLQQKLIDEKMQVDIKMLRSQINPHFFFNALNNIYAIALRNKDVETGAAILKLSAMMRFMLYESNAEVVLLEREIEQIEYIIDMARLKYSKNKAMDIHIEIQGHFADTKVAPLLLIPFVENAVKHGLNPKGEGYIDIAVQCEPKRLLFKVKNTMQDNRDSLRSHSGIGLENVKRRLALLYPERHKLSISNSEDSFVVELTLEVDE